MIIAEKKRKENIAEYILYMYQVEDLIRGNDMDIDHIEQSLIRKFDVPYEVKREMREWYKTLITMMKDEGKEETGHLNILNSVVDNLERLHGEVLRQGIDNGYGEIFRRAKPNLDMLRMKSGGRDEGDIQVAMNGLYGLLILKLKKTRITEETSRAFDTIRELVAELTLRYMEKTELN